MPIVCPRCGEENPDRARFCMACTEPLAAPAQGGEERKVVSVLFADLVGHTAASERADPEDVRARLSAFHSRVKADIERFGGAVEKFVGDAVMAVFGAPTAHEDDAERAVRAGLAILDAVEELGVSVRVGVNTGEAVVALAARPELGESVVTGDVVNTAARLQSSAAVGTLVVGEQSYWATRHVIDYEALEPAVAKGKAEPVVRWQAVGARSRFGVDLEPGRDAPLVGRDDELAVVRQACARAVRESACHLVTVIGEAGIGKSRLVAEFRAELDAAPDIVYWRQGRCLPYGDGIAFWALGEIVKAHAGVLESDDAASARSKLDAAVEPLVENAADRSWLTAALARLVGAAHDDAAGAASREESFTAWRTFLESIASQGPLVLVVEDLHWADAALLEFLEHLTDFATDVPLFVVCTARPELHESHPTWSGGKRNATTISLSPLTSEETARLVAALLERAVLPAELQQQLLERAGGNPLYAEQFVRMLRERPEGDVAVPETVQALIAARLDTLASERKGLLQDAAVVGKVFWAGAVASMGEVEEQAVRSALHDLVRRELIRPARRSSVEGHAEYAFGHALVRDVAYAQIPRAARAQKHEAAARWIETIAGERVSDHAELLAHHYQQALALASASGGETMALEDKARRFLVLAGERASVLDVRRAEALFEAALAITPSGHPARGRILAAMVEHGGGEERPVPQILALLQEAREELRASGDEIGFAKATLVLSHVKWVAGDNESSVLLDEAVEQLERHPPGPELAHAYALCAGRGAISGRSQEALAWAAKGIELAEQLGLEHFRQRCVQFQGLARFALGDPSGVEDLRRSLEESLALGLSREAEIGFHNYASVLWESEGADPAIAVYRDGIDYYERRGRSAIWTKGELTWPLFDAGRWDEALALAAELETLAATHGKDQPLLMALSTKGRILFYRGHVDEAHALAEELLPQAREVGDPQLLLPTLSLAVLVGAGGDPLELVEELLAVEAPSNPLYADAARACLSQSGLELVERMIRTDERASTRARHIGVTVSALLAEARGEREEAAALYAEAVRRWTEYPFVLERAHALLGVARTTSDREAAREARDLFRSLDAVVLEREAAAAA